MKVLQINVTCGRGSTGRIATDLSDVVKAAGHDCRIAYGRESVPEQYQKIAHRIGTDLDVKLHGVATRLLDAHGFASKKVTESFLKWVEDYDPDVVHLHNIHGYYIHAGLLFDYLKRVNKPVVWTLHDCWSFTGHCSHFESAGCSRWKTGCTSPCPLKKEYPQSLLLDRCETNYASKKEAFTGIADMTIVTPSLWLAEYVKNSYLGMYPVQVMPNGIDMTVFRPTEGCFREKYGLEGKKIILGVTNVWTKSKGLSDFVQLSKLLPEDMKVVLVGLTAEQIAQLPTEILGIQRTTSPQELAEIYSTADVFVNPTHEDNFPTTNLEALACGTPVITYRTGGSPEAVDETCGLVVDRDPAQIAKAVVTHEWTKDACLKRASRYDKRAMGQAYLKLYTDVLRK